MSKDKMLEFCKKLAEEWKTLTYKEKCKEITSSINKSLENEDKDEKTRRGLQQLLIILDENESEELESYLDMLNEIIMKKCRENIEKNYK